MSFLLVLLYIIATFLRPQEWVPFFYGKPVVDVLAATTLFFIIFESLGTRKLQLTKAPQNGLLAWFYFAICMSHVVHTYLAGLIASFWSFLVVFVLFLILINGINTEKKYKVAVWLIILLIVLLVFQGMYQLDRGYGWAGQYLTQDPHRGEVRINWIGIFNDPNDLALAFVMGVGFLLPFFIGRSGFIPRLTSFISIGLLMYGVYMTNSRGGLLALMTTVYFFFVRKTKRFVLGGIVGGIFAALIFVLGPSRAAIISVSEDSAYGRAELWYEGILMMKRNPLFGVGHNMFVDQLPQTAHNSFILAGAELGLFGLFFWVALLYCSFKGLSLIQEKNKRLYNHALGLQSALVGFSAAAFFLSRTYVMLPFILFALSGSLMDIAKQENKDLDFRFTKKDARTTFLLSIGSLLLAYVVIKVAL